jgi:hypothetical protein
MSDAENHAAFRRRVEVGEALGHQDRVLERKHENAGPEGNPPGRSDHEGEGCNRLHEDGAIGGRRLEKVVDDPKTVKAKVFCAPGEILKEGGAGSRFTREHVRGKIDAEPQRVDVSGHRLKPPEDATGGLIRQFGRTDLGGARPVRGCFRLTPDLAAKTSKFSRLRHSRCPRFFRRSRTRRDGATTGRVPSAAGPRANLPRPLAGRTESGQGRSTRCQAIRPRARR